MRIGRTLPPAAAPMTCADLWHGLGGLVSPAGAIRTIEAEINRRRGEADRRTEIPLTNFRGIELRHFSAEIARLALIIAEYQCDVLYRGEKLAMAEFLPLEAANWITCGNALRLDWLSICPPTGKGVKNRADDLFATPLDQAEIDFDNKGGETYVCGNPPYVGGKKQSAAQKEDMARIFGRDEKHICPDEPCGRFCPGLLSNVSRRRRPRVRRRPSLTYRGLRGSDRRRAYGSDAGGRGSLQLP